MSRALVRIGRFAVAGVVLWLLFRRVDLAGIAGSILGAGLGLPLGAAALSLVSQTAVGVRLQRLVRAEGMGLSVPEVLEVNLTTRFYSYLLPAGNVAGVAIRFYRLSDSETARRRLIAALLCDRILATLALCVVGLAFWELSTPHTGLTAALVMAALLVGLLAFTALMAAPTAVLPASGRRLGRGRTGALLRRLDSLREAVNPVRSLDRRTLLEVALLSLAAQLLGVAACALLARSLALGLTVPAVAWTRSAALVAALLPVSVAGLGLREGALVLLLAPYGVSPAHALAYSLLVFIATNLSMVLVGGLLEGRRLLR